MITEAVILNLSTKGFCDIIDISGEVEKIVYRSGVRDGLCTVFVPGSTAGVTTIEAEPGVMQDLRNAIERLAPQDMKYNHDARWGDGNGFSHVRAALLGPGLSIPVKDKQLVNGTWQQVVLADFDNRPRERRVVVQVLGEAG